MSAERLQVINRHLKNVQLPVDANERSSSFFDDREFYYTVNNSILTNEQRWFYEKNGYILMHGLIEDELLDECCQHFIDICDGKISKGNMILMKDVSLAKSNVKGQYLYNKAQDILFDEVFEKYISHERLLDLVECFTGPNIKAVHSMLINKPPDSGLKTSRHPLHQDLYYFPFRPADRIVAAWTAMEKVTVDNGCLVVVPGSHRQFPGGTLLQHGYPNWEGGVNKAYHGIIGCDDIETIPVVMEKGDTVFFHPLLLHGSGANITKGFRKAISCHYAAAECDYIEVSGTIQQNIADEVVEMAKKRGYSLTMKGRKPAQPKSYIPITIFFKFIAGIVAL